MEYEESGALIPKPRSEMDMKNYDGETQLYIVHFKSQNINTPISHHLILYIYLLLKYHVKANCCVSAANGVGTSASPGLATGCLKYTVEQIL